MHKFFSVAALAAVTMLMGGCGGSAFDGGTTKTITTVASIAVSSDTTSIPLDGSSGAAITVVAKDANNAAVAGAVIAFTASSGNITVTQATTDATGTAKATLVAGSATAGATITVTAANGSVSGTTNVTVANTQKTLTLLTSLPSIPSDGSKTAKITAYVRDANNNFVSGQTVLFQATSGGLAVTQGTTDASGTAIATLGAAADPTNRTITVTATAGNATATINVSVGGTKLTVSGPASLVQGAVGTFTVSLTDAGSNGIAGQAITLTSALGNTLTPASFTTDATGQKTFTLTATKSGTDTVTATGAGLAAASPPVTISNQNFTFTAPTVGTKANLGTASPVTVNWLSAGVPQAGQTITFSATRGTLSAATAVTDAAGNAGVTITSTLSGPSVVSATATGVTAQASLDFIATTASALKAQASPASIPTQGSSTITVTVRDPANNLVEGKVVNFSITQDSTGGSLSVASATTDSQGQASTAYTASTTTSAKDGVVISATVAGTAVTGSTSLTVAGQTVFLSLGTGNKIFSYPDANGVQYKLPYAVQAVDNAGHGVDNVPITITITSLAYLKGYWVKTASTPPWSLQPTTSQPTRDPITGVITPSSDPDAYTLSGTAGCKSEDVNNDGIYNVTNDYNTNGHLDPGLVVSSDVSSVTTANGGSGSFNLIYPKDHAEWVAVRLTATATVAGTQSSTFADFWLPILADDITSATVAPPGVNSPYGQATTCLDKN